MNCKPGDLAEYVFCKGISFPQYIGKKFIVISEAEDDDGLAVWNVIPMFYADSGECHDICLRPIRPEEAPEESTEAMKKLTKITEKV